MRTIPTLALVSIACLMGAPPAAALEACTARPTRGCALEHLRDGALAGTDAFLVRATVSAALAEGRLDIAVALAGRLDAGSDAWTWGELVGAMVRAGRRAEAERLIARAGLPLGAVAGAIAEALAQIGEAEEADRVLAAHPPALPALRNLALAEGHALAGRTERVLALLALIPDAVERESVRRTLGHRLAVAVPGTPGWAVLREIQPDLAWTASLVARLSVEEARAVRLSAVREGTERAYAAIAVGHALVAAGDWRGALAAARHAASEPFARIELMALIAGMSGEREAFAALTALPRSLDELNEAAFRRQLARAYAMAGRMAAADEVVAAAAVGERDGVQAMIARGLAERGEPALALRALGRIGDRERFLEALVRLVDDLPPG